MASIGVDDCCIVNGGGGAWAFTTLAEQLASALWIDVAESPRRFNYLLAMDEFDVSASGELFIPYQSMQLAADKRLLAKAFATSSVPTPETWLVDTLEEAKRILQENQSRDWCLKYPTSCGASGHRMLTTEMNLPKNWPVPLIVQEFVKLDHPEVFRLYGAGGRVFGWVARRFASGVKASPWVAHARGARYESAGEAPTEAVAAGVAALKAVGLLESFGCVDLLRRRSGEFVVLEVGTDGLFNHVDRELNCPELEEEILRRIAESFWARVGWQPWGSGSWFPRPAAAA
jgi:glutathione synthase/RimK-type ligase-like ATP-grasp enzyme